MQGPGGGLIRRSGQNEGSGQWGKESNWVQTVSGKGWHMLFRLYGPEQAWFDKTWRPGELELVE